MLDYLENKVSQDKEKNIFKNFNVIGEECKKYNFSISI